MLFEDETIVWRFALPRAGWWRKDQRYRLADLDITRGQIKRQEAQKRQAWRQYRSWSRITSGVLLSVIGAVQYGTSNVFFKVVPHFDAHDFRQFIHQIMQALGKAQKEIVMVVDRSGIHRAKALESTLRHWRGKFRLYFLPARAGHTLNPMEGFWRPTKEAIGAGRCFADIHGLYQRTRHVLLAHKEQPIFRFAW